jgi:surface antigen
MEIKMKLKKLVVSCSIFTILAGATMQAQARDNVLGTLIGAAGGAAIGSNIGKGKGRIAAIAVGTLVGAGVGSAISGGGPVYAADYHPEYRGNHRNGWYSGHHRGYYQPYYGTTTTYTTVYPATTYYVEPQPQVVQVNNYQEPQESQEYCREFNQGITIGGKVQPGYGIACLQPDGSWQIKKQ